MPDEDGWPTFEEWRGTLSEDRRARVDALVTTMRNAGAREPEEWARSEVEEDIAQAARFSFLRAVWRDLDQWRNEATTEAYLAELDVDAAVRERLGGVLAKVALQAALDVVMVLDNEEDVGSVDELPGWRLMELDTEGNLSGRDVGGLHESFYDVDPRDRSDGEDITGW